MAEVRFAPAARASSGSPERQPVAAAKSFAFADDTAIEGPPTLPLTPARARAVTVSAGQRVLPTAKAQPLPRDASGAYLKLPVAKSITLSPKHVDSDGRPQTPSTVHTNRVLSPCGSTTSVTSGQSGPYLNFPDGESTGTCSSASPQRFFPAGLPHTVSEYTEMFRAPSLSEKFVSPCTPLGVSGGTAAFFHVRYKEGREPPGTDPDYYLGKDLAHAKDEVDFYMALRDAKETSASWAAFAKACMDCPGVTRLQCVDPEVDALEMRSLLLLQNLRQGFQKLRLIDVKLGAETSVTGWKGKSRIHAWKNQCVDQRTNSTVEGFRLEGIDSPPPALDQYVQSAIVLRSSRNFPGAGFVSPKQVSRFTMQRLRAHQFLGYLFDASSMGAGAERHSHGAIWSSLEAMGQVMQAVIEIPVPQQWIGSSFALGMEVGRLEAAPKVIAKVFDWGRSELTTAAQYARLGAEKKSERFKYWSQYVRALVRINWELCRIAAHRCCCATWPAFVFEVRCEPISVVRAALLGESIVQPTGVGIFELPREGVHPGGSKVVIPLLGPKEGSKEAHKAGMLHLHVSAQAAEKRGMGPVVLQLQGATNVRDQEYSNGKVVVVVRVIGFENVSDARSHMDAWSRGDKEPVPRGRAYASKTAPARITKDALVWEDRVEFLGLGYEAANAARERLHGLLPSTSASSGDACLVLAESMPAHELCHEDSSECDGELMAAAMSLQSFLEDDREKPPSWEEILPPTLGESPQVEAVATSFLRRVAPWAEEGSPCPSHWL